MALSIERQSVSASDGTCSIFKDPRIYRIRLHLCIQHLHHAVWALFNIYAQTFLQKSTPNHLLGKVASMVTMVVMCSYPIGQSLYGILLETFAERVDLLILFACIASLIISLLSRNALKTIGNDCEKEAVLIQ